MKYDTLQLGSIGDEVIVLQQKLKMLGFYNAIITGSFGLSTEVGVRAFQRAMGLEETRVVNDETWNMLLQYTQSSIVPISTFPTLKLGSTGNSVKDLQLKLKALLYYTSSINSNFDTETEIAVKRFQLNNKLTADGIVGTNTWNLINTLYGNLNECAIEDNSEQTPDEITYIVQSGDTLYAIAKKYNTTVDEIKRINNLTSNNLQIGQILKIPITEQTNEEFIEYKVISGDTLYAIAKKYNTTVDEIKRVNNLTSNNLRIGQILKILVNQ